jgi:hypothetical protein
MPNAQQDVFTGSTFLETLGVPLHLASFEDAV